MRPIIIVLLVCSMTACKDKVLQTEHQIIADFEMQIDAINYHKVHFTNKSENGVLYTWYFGNGDSSNIENPTYSYPAAGIYEVCLVVYDASGNWVSKTQTLILYDIHQPEADMV